MIFSEETGKYKGHKMEGFKIMYQMSVKPNTAEISKDFEKTIPKFMNTMII